MPYASDRQRRYLNAHPEITDKKGRSVARVFNQHEHDRKVGKSLRYGPGSTRASRHVEKAVGVKPTIARVKPITPMKPLAAAQPLKPLKPLAKADRLPARRGSSELYATAKPTGRRFPRGKVAAGAGGALVLGGGGVALARRKPVEKAARRYDPEDRRRQRLGIYTAGAGAAGVGGLGYAARDARSATRIARQGSPFTPNHPRNVRVVELDDVDMGDGKKATKVKGRFLNNAVIHQADRLKGGGLAITRRGALAGLGGLASLGAAGAMHRSSKQPRWN